MDKSKEEFYDEYETLFKRLGQGSTTGKIVGLLMIGEEPQLDLDRISDLVDRSKSTVHNSIKRLEEIGIVRVDIADDTKSEGRYKHLYSFNEYFWEEQLKQLDTVTIFKNLIGDAITYLEDHHEQDPRISEYKRMYALYGWFEVKLPEMFDEWNEKLRTGEYLKYVDEIYE